MSTHDPRQTSMYLGEEPPAREPPPEWHLALAKHQNTPHPSVSFKELPTIAIGETFLVFHCNGQCVHAELEMFNGRKAVTRVTLPSNENISHSVWNIPVYDTKTMKAGIPLGKPMWYIDKVTLARLRKAYWNTPR